MREYWNLSNIYVTNLEYISIFYYLEIQVMALAGIFQWMKWIFEIFGNKNHEFSGNIQIVEHESKESIQNI